MCAVPLGSRKEVPDSPCPDILLFFPGVIRPKHLLSVQKLYNIFKKLPLIRILSSELHSLWDFSMAVSFSFPSHL